MTFPSVLFLLSACSTATSHPFPQVLTMEQFRQQGRSLDYSPLRENLVMVSPSYRQVRRYPFENDVQKKHSPAVNSFETMEIEEKIRKVNEALDKEIEKEEKEIEDLLENASFVENVLEEIKEIETELVEEAIEEDLEMEDVNLSSLVDTQNVPMNLVLIPITHVDFEINQEIE